MVRYSGARTWNMTETETLNNLSIHFVSTVCPFLWYVALSTPRNVVSVDSLTLTSLTLVNTLLAA